MKFRSGLLIFLFSFFCFSLNAQVFIGGDLGFNITNDKTMYGNTASDYSLNLSPVAGKFLSEKIAAGVALDISLYGNTSGTDPEITTKSNSLGGSLFLRYYAIKWNKFSVFGQGNLGLAFTNSSTKTDGTTTNGPKSTRLYLSIYPGLSYDINDKLSLQTSLNILSFGYNYKTTRLGTSKDINSSIGFGAGLSNIVSIGDITIGAIYKF
jgi:hypothetical protein